ERRSAEAGGNALRLEAPREPLVEMLLLVLVLGPHFARWCLDSRHRLKNDTSNMSGMPLDAIDTWVGDGDVPAVAAAIVGRDGIRDLRVAGNADEHSLFALASLTKPLVALAVLVAAEEGAIDLDAPAADHLAAYGRPSTEAITARHLLAHA